MDQIGAIIDWDGSGRASVFVNKYKILNNIVYKLRAQCVGYYAKVLVDKNSKPNQTLDFPRQNFTTGQIPNKTNTDTVFNHAVEKTQ